MRVHSSGEVSFSIIVAVRNGQTILDRCLQSIAAQTYSKREMIVIDGGSRDGTADLIRRYEDRIAYWISEPDRGIYDAWNKGVVRARGEWLCFVGADDYFWDRDVLKRVSVFLEGVPDGISVVYGRVALVTTEGNVVAIYGEPWDRAGKLFPDLMSIPHPGAMHRRSLFERRGLFDTDFRIAGDYEFLLRELREKEAAFMPDIIVVGMRMGGVSSTPEGMYRSLVEVRKAQVEHGRRYPGWRWMVAFLKTAIRLSLFRVIGDRRARVLMDKGRAFFGKAPFWTVK